MIDSKGMDSEGMEGKHRKIFGSNSKVSISKVSNPTGSSYMFGIESVGKYFFYTLLHFKRRIYTYFSYIFIIFWKFFN